MSKKIPLQNGMFAIVDDEDYERASRFDWYFVIKETMHSVARTDYQQNKRKVRMLSHLVLGEKITKEKVVIHKDGDGLNNKKENLLITERKNMNKFKRGNVNSSSQYKGVHWATRENCWQAQITFKGKNIYLGRFSKEEDAALTYNAATRELFGENAYQNITGKNNNATLINGAKQRVRQAITKLSKGCDTH